MGRKERRGEEREKHGVERVIWMGCWFSSTSILLCSGLAVVISSTYSIKKPLNDSVFGAHGEFMLPLKYVVILLHKVRQPGGLPHQHFQQQCCCILGDSRVRL